MPVKAFLSAPNFFEGNRVVPRKCSPFRLLVREKGFLLYVVC